jgi:two-component system OmpR family response regulator
MSLKAYIVEDNALIRDNLVETLTEVLGIETVGHASTENGACHWLSQHPQGWDVLILDLFLLQGTGLGVLQRCGEHSASQRVVVLSNYATDEVRQRCLACGADAVFDKSTEIDQFLTYCDYPH